MYRPEMTLFGDLQLFDATQLGHTESAPPETEVPSASELAGILEDANPALSYLQVQTYIADICELNAQGLRHAAWHVFHEAINWSIS